MKRAVALPSHKSLGQFRLSAIATGLLLAGIGVAPPTALAVNIVNNPTPGCAVNTAFYDPGNGEDIVVPKGFTVSVFAKDLNFPVGIAFKGDKDNFEVYVLESGHGLPSRCNDEHYSPVVRSRRTTRSRLTSSSSTRTARRGAGGPRPSPPRRA